MFRMNNEMSEVSKFSGHDSTLTDYHTGTRGFNIQQSYLSINEIQTWHIWLLSPNLNSFANAVDKNIYYSFAIKNQNIFKSFNNLNYEPICSIKNSKSITKTHKKWTHFKAVWDKTRTKN